MGLHVRKKWHRKEEQVNHLLPFCPLTEPLSVMTLDGEELEIMMTTKIISVKYSTDISTSEKYKLLAPRLKGEGEKIDYGKYHSNRK